MSGISRKPSSHLVFFLAPCFLRQSSTSFLACKIGNASEYHALLTLRSYGKTHAHTYRAFYVIAAAEMVLNIGISSKWKVVSFKHTHLVERMSLLTLYILGEGVIDVLKNIGLVS
jgi:low temperature requirement protein LtrA